VVHRFYDEFDIIPHYVQNLDKLKTALETVILIRLGRVYYDYVLCLDDTRDLCCFFNVIVGYGDTMIDCLMELCIKLKGEIYDDVRSLFYERYLREVR
jgi:hypothetical protein